MKADRTESDAAPGCDENRDSSRFRHPLSCCMNRPSTKLTTSRATTSRLHRRAPWRQSAKLRALHPWCPRLAHFMGQNTPGVNSWQRSGRSTYRQVPGALRRPGFAFEPCNQFMVRTRHFVCVLRALRDLTRVRPAAGVVSQHLHHTVVRMRARGQSARDADISKR